MTISIPDRHKAGIEVLSLLSDKDFKKLLSAIKDVPLGASDNEFVNIIKSQCSFDSVDQVSRALFSLIGVCALKNENIDELVQEVSLSLASSSDELVDDKILTRFANRLKNVLIKATNVKLTFKAYNVFFDAPNLFRGSNISTSLNIVSDDVADSDKKPIAVLVSRLTIHHGDEGDSTHFTLDSTDLVKFRDELDKAIAKENEYSAKYSTVFEFIELDQS